MTDVKNIQSKLDERTETKDYQHPLHKAVQVHVERRYKGDRLDRVITDYTLGNKTVRVIDFKTSSSFGRNNAELIQLGTNLVTRSYKYADNAKVKAIELLLG